METPIVLRMAPDLRRCAWYWLVGLGLVVCTMSSVIAYLNAILAEPPPGPFWPIYSALAIYPLLSLIPLRWALRVDERGMSRRRLFGWDLWSWDDIAAGRIQKGPPFVLIDPRRPWGRRKLSMQSMTPTDRNWISDRINTLYRLPAPPELPESVEVQTVPLAKKMRLDADGLQMMHKRQWLRYTWSDVRRVRITRAEPLRRDYVRLLIVLPDREIHLARGVRPEVVSTFVERYAPADRIDVDIDGQRPARRCDVEKLLERHDKEVRELRIIFWVAALGGVAVNVMGACDGSLTFTIVLTLVFGAFMAALVVVVGNEFRQQRQKLEQWLASYPPAD